MQRCWLTVGEILELDLMSVTKLPCFPHLIVGIHFSKKFYWWGLRRVHGAANVSTGVPGKFVADIDGRCSEHAAEYQLMRLPLISRNWAHQENETSLPKKVAAFNMSFLKFCIRMVGIYILFPILLVQGIWCSDCGARNGAGDPTLDKCIERSVHLSQDDSTIFREERRYTTISSDKRK